MSRSCLRYLVRLSPVAIVGIRRLSTYKPVPTSFNDEAGAGFLPFTSICLAFGEPTSASNVWCPMWETVKSVGPIRDSCIGEISELYEGIRLERKRTVKKTRRAGSFVQ